MTTQSVSGALCTHGKDPKETSPQLQQPEQGYLSELLLIHLLNNPKLMTACLSLLSLCDSSELNFQPTGAHNTLRF